MSVPTPILQYNLSDATMKGLLPAGYTPLAYIESSGTLWINSGIALNEATSTYTFSCRVGASTRDGHAHSFFGMASYLTGMMGIYHYTNNNYYAFYIKGLAKSPTNYVISKGNIFDFYLKMDLSNNTYESKIDKDTLKSGSFNAMTDTTTTIRVFKSDDFSGGYWKCYYFRIAKDNVLQVDLVPARRDSDGVIGMYDLVSRTFKTNSGSGAFIAGPELAVGKGGGKSLPEEYLLIEYLESEDNVNCYINTSFVPNNNTRLITTIYPTSVRTDAHFWFGSRNGSSASQAFVFYQSGAATGGLNAAWNTSGNVGISQSGQKWYNIDFNKNILQVNGTTAHTFTAGTFTGTYPIFLFAMNTSGSMDGLKGGQRIQNTKIYDNGTIVRNMIPCYRKSDGKPGMYDTVNGVFYMNAGSGEFILGPSITNTYTYEPNAGSGTLLGFYTNLSGIYDSSKGWVAGFNGSNYISTPGFSQNDIKSIALWVKAPNLNNLVWYCDAKAKTGLGIYSSSFIIGSRGRSLPVFGLNGFTANTWYHIVVVYNSTPELYINGVKYTGSGGNEWSSDDNNLMLIGTRLYSGALNLPFSGQISNFMVFNTALTAAQVKELYGK